MWTRPLLISNDICLKFGLKESLQVHHVSRPAVLHITTHTPDTVNTGFHYVMTYNKKNTGWQLALGVTEQRHRELSKTCFIKNREVFQPQGGGPAGGCE